MRKVYSALLSRLNFGTQPQLDYILTTPTRRG